MGKKVVEFYREYDLFHNPDSPSYNAWGDKEYSREDDIREVIRENFIRFTEKGHPLQGSFDVYLAQSSDGTIAKITLPEIDPLEMGDEEKYTRRVSVELAKKDGRVPEDLSSLLEEREFIEVKN